MILTKKTGSQGQALLPASSTGRYAQSGGGASPIAGPDPPPCGVAGGGDGV